MLNRETLPILQSLGHFLLIQRQASEVDEIFSPLSRDVGTPVRNLGQLHRRHT
jgi:hypothetical protein